jgi:hypothetical protein
MAPNNLPSVTLPPPGFQDLPRRRGRYAASENGEIYSYFSDRVLRPSKHSGGYLSVMLSKGGRTKRYFVHSLIWQTYRGASAVGCEIDHINRIKTDNRLCNLRCVPHSSNQHNRGKTSPKAPTLPQSKFKGVHYIGSGCIRKWRAMITIAGYSLVIGRFYTDKEAAVAFDKVAESLPGLKVATNHSLGYFT